jgi:UDP-glucose 4-epimerase
MGILITGGTGFIGKRLTKALENDHDSIKVVSRNSNAEYQNLIVCDLAKDRLNADILEDVTTIIHLAAYTHDLRNPSKLRDIYKSINVDATMNLAKIAIQANIERFIFISSTKAGQANINNALDDYSHIDQAQGIYGRTKREAEINLLEIAKNSSMRVDIIRPALVYGPNAKGNLAKMLNGIDKGWFPPLPNTDNRRSMIHVDDLVRAIIFIEKNTDSNNEIFIATDGKNYSAAQIYNNLCEVLGKPIPNWRLPLVILKMISFISPNFKYKIQKLIGDEYYSSEKLESIGFKPKLTLRDMNEKIF